MQRDPRGRRGHKDLQVCRQVYDALTFALAELDDPLIDELVLVSVTPAPSAARATCIRHRVTYSMGGSPTTLVKRAANAEREDAIASASAPVRSATICHGTIFE